MATPNVDLYAPPLSPAKLRFTAADPFTPTHIERVVTHQNANAKEIYQTRVRGRMLLLDNAAKQTKWREEMKAKKEKERLAKERRKLGPTGRRQGTARSMGLWSFEPSQAKFALFLPLHQLWLGYMSELLNLPQPGSGPPRILSGLAVHPRLVKADFHGSIITGTSLHSSRDYVLNASLVHQTKNSSILGMSGIVIHETEGTFKIVTKDDKLKILPKRNSIFTFALPVFSTLPASHTANAPLPLPIPQGTHARTVLDGPHVTIELYGNQFCYRSADKRAETRPLSLLGPDARLLAAATACASAHHPRPTRAAVDTVPRKPPPSNPFAACAVVRQRPGRASDWGFAIFRTPCVVDDGDGGEASNRRASSTLNHPPIGLPMHQPQPHYAPLAA
uniref:Uncharacterized protein n=1 Tax=Mycena chlorophos TaxID=658473 RepID=A0ABQ0LA59_MYCCL|nr:predicted protein [Mycena chlorophos]